MPDDFLDIVHVEMGYLRHKDAVIDQLRAEADDLRDHIRRLLWWADEGWAMHRQSHAECIAHAESRCAYGRNAAWITAASRTATPPTPAPEPAVSDTPAADTTGRR